MPSRGSEGMVALESFQAAGGREGGCPVPLGWQVLVGLRLPMKGIRE